MRNLLAALCSICWLTMPVQGDSIVAELQRGAGVRNADIPIYSDGVPQLSMLVHIDAAYMDYEQHGFFRIGLFPVAVLEGVTFEPRRTQPAADVLGLLSRELGINGGRHVELRRVKFVFSRDSTLEAERVKCLTDGEWRLIGVRSREGQHALSAARGTLYLEGERAGQLILESNPHQTNFVSFTAATK